MIMSNKKSFIAGLTVLLFFSCTPETAQEDAVESGFYKPWESLGPLFHEVQMAGLYPDSKTFVDCVPKRPPAEILSDYLELREEAVFDLDAFVKANFEEPEVPSNTAYEGESDFELHLKEHWDYLTRSSGDADAYSTLIALPEDYVVPGGRFREIYYWDSYFTMIGLGASGRTDLVEAMVDNFAFLIDSVGFIPNGNRTYYLGRSQPPYFASMVNLLMQLTSDENGLNYLSAVQQEYDFWMKGVDKLSENQKEVNRVVRLADGTILNRYWDFLSFPRPESYKEDVELAEHLADAEKPQLYRNLRAGAESGWDYSTRWFSDKEEFGTIRTIDMLPVDLNCLLFSVENTLANLYELAGDDIKATAYLSKAEDRRAAIQQVFWNDKVQAFTDYVWRTGELEDQVTMAGAYPLYFLVATPEQARLQAATLERELLQPGGLVTTKLASGQQWDFPNGWAPLQWIGVKGLEHYGHKALADAVRSRWLTVNEKVYRNTGKMMEKYNVADTTLLAGGGEYPTQDGFGWTNGVVLGLLADDAAY